MVRGGEGASQILMARKTKYYQVQYGEWIRPTKRGFREQCCDCSLIHVLDFRIVDGAIEFRTRRDDKATAAARRAFKFSKDD